jgi:hypothetical protein
MSDFMPVERIDFAEFGSLTAMTLSENSVIMLQLKPGVQLDMVAAQRLRERTQSIFPDNPVVVMDGSMMDLKVYDFPTPEPTPDQVLEKKIRVVANVISLAIMAVRVVRWARHRRHAV